MGLTQHIVIGVVSWRHLQTTRTELDIHIAVFNHRDDAVHERYNHLAPLQPLVLRILGVDTHGGITHDGLRTGSCHYCIIALLILVDDITLCLQSLLVVERLQVSHIIFQVEQMALLLFIDHLFGRKGGECLRIPVHHAESAIDEPLVVEIDKHLDHTLTALFIHGEGRTVPIATGTEATQLLQDDTAVLVGPVPSVFQELLTGQVTLLDAFACELLHHLCLSSD